MLAVEINTYPNHPLRLLICFIFNSYQFLSLSFSFDVFDYSFNFQRFLITNQLTLMSAVYNTDLDGMYHYEDCLFNFNF